MRWLLDQGLPRSTSHWLQSASHDSASHDSLHVGDIGMADARDSEILAEAVRQKRVLVTLDADFHALLAISASKQPSVIRIREEGLKGRAIANIVLHIASRFSHELEQGCVFSYRDRKLRFRFLPLLEAKP